MKEVSRFLLKQATELFEREQERDAFLHALLSAAEPPPSIAWTRDRQSGFEVETPYSWQPPYIDFLKADSRPGKNALHDEGYYYVLDPSSVFASVPLTVVEHADVAFDLCAAPGGKSILTYLALKPQLLVCNEVIGKRLPALISNVKRCALFNTIVTKADPSIFAKTVPGNSDLVFVDAPCSGQSLLVKGKRSPGCFHPATINQNANRQKRIISHAATCVRLGGYLLYTTCTFAFKENEGVSEWFLKKNPEFKSVLVPALAEHQSHLTDIHSYRLWPHRLPGAGAYTILFQRDGQGESMLPGNFPITPVWQSEIKRSGENL